MSSVTKLKSIDDFNLHDVEALRLVLRGGSVIDWHRLNFTDKAQADHMIRMMELDPGNSSDRDYLERTQQTAVAYLRRNFQFPVPKPVELASMEDLMLMASGTGHRQLCACTILKTIHIINHLAGRELLFRLPVSDRDLFHLVEEKVYRIVGTMLGEGFPVVEFVGGRKNLDSIWTKLLSKPEATATAVYDKLRFRIVTQSRDDLLPVLEYLTGHLFPFNYVVAGESINTILHFRSYCESHPHLREMTRNFQGVIEDSLNPGDNRFSAPTYRVVHFVTDIPVRVPPHVLDRAPGGSEEFGKVLYMLCEFQLVDAMTEAANEAGDASHSAYKSRQRKAVLRRLRVGARKPMETTEPPPSEDGSDG